MALASRAQDASCVGELSFWSGLLSERSLSLVDGSLDAARDTMGTAGRLTLTLPAAVTQALLTRVPAAFHCGIQHVLLAGLALAIAQWCGRRGISSAAMTRDSVDALRPRLFAAPVKPPARMTCKKTRAESTGSMGCWELVQKLQKSCSIMPPRRAARRCYLK